MVREIVILKPSRMREGEGARVRQRNECWHSFADGRVLHTNALAFVCLKMTQSFAKPLQKSLVNLFKGCGWRAEPSLLRNSPTNQNLKLISPEGPWDNSFSAVRQTACLRRGEFRFHPRAKARRRSQKPTNPRQSPRLQGTWQRRNRSHPAQL